MKKDLIILEEDKNWARKRIAELDAAIQDLGPEFYDVFNQSSETWHDNAPFDALRDRQSVLDAERQLLRALLRSAFPGAPTVHKSRVSIGSKVQLDSGKVYFIAGDWTPHAGTEQDGVMTISAQSPLALSLLSKKVGDTVRLGKKVFNITALH